MSRDLSLGERVFVSAMNGLSLVSRGFVAGFTAELVRQHGVGGFFKFAGKTEGLWNQMVARFGERDAHLLASLASFWNGCDYCAYGHMLAFNLHVFHDSHELFPISEQEIPRLLRERDADVMARLRVAFGGPRFARQLELLERQFALKMGTASPSTDEDRAITQANALYEWVNECSIVVEAPAPPLGKIAKHKSLQREYVAARQKANGSTAAVG